MNVRYRVSRVTLLALIPASLVFASLVHAQLNNAVPTELETVGVEEHLDARLPLELPFIDDNRRPVKLGDLFTGARPVILTLNYSDCPMLCSLQLNGLFDALEKMEWELGKQFDMITVSIDPLETPQRARLTKQKYLRLYGRGQAGAYHCLTGKDENIKALAATVGFKYTYSEETRQYAHAAVTFVCTPDGRVSRYLYGVEYNPQTVKFALLEAGQGKVGTTVDRFILACFHYDAEAGRYGPSAFRLMQAGGGFTVIMIGGVMWVVWRRDARRKKRASAAGGESVPEPHSEK